MTSVTPLARLGYPPAGPVVQSGSSSEVTIRQYSLVRASAQDPTTHPLLWWRQNARQLLLGDLIVAKVDEPIRPP